MKYIVELTTSNPSHEHVSFRRVQKKTNFVVEANSEAEALMRARGKFRSLGHYVHEAKLIEQKTVPVENSQTENIKEEVEQINEWNPWGDKDYKDDRNTYGGKIVSPENKGGTQKFEYDASEDELEDPVKLRKRIRVGNPDLHSHQVSAIVGSEGYSTHVKIGKDVHEVHHDDNEFTPDPDLAPKPAKKMIGKMKEEVEQVDEAKKENKAKKNKYVRGLGLKAMKAGLIDGARGHSPTRFGRETLKKEEVEYIEEKLKASDPASKWISDFVASDNPKFEGKSKKERINMALGAYYAAKRANEEVSLEEQERPVANPNAVPKKSKEPKEPGTTDYSKEVDPAVPAKHPLEAERAKVEAEVRKRQAELAKQAAEKKKTNEEVEQMDESAKEDAEKLLGGPVKEKPKMPPGKQPAGYRYVRGLARKAMKAGMKKEEVEQVDEAKGKPPAEFMPSDTKLPRIKVPAKPKPGVRKRGPIGSFNKKGFWNPGVREEVEQVVEISESSGDAPINKMTHADLADYVNKSAQWVEKNREEAEKMAHEMTMDMSEEAINELLIGKAIKAVAKRIDDKIVGGRIDPPKPPAKPPVASGAADVPKPAPASQPLPTEKPVKDMSADEYKQYYDRRAITRRAVEKAQRSAPPSGVSVKSSQNPYAKLANEQKTLMTYEKNPPASEKISSSETTMDTETKRSDAEAQKKTKAAAAAEKLVKAIKNKINVKPEMSANPEQKEVK